MAQKMQPFLSANPSSSTGATSSSDGSNGHGLPSTAKPSEAPLASGSSPDTSDSMDWESSPSIDISLATRVVMDEDTNPVGSTTLPKDIRPCQSAARALTIRGPMVTSASSNGTSGTSAPCKITQLRRSRNVSIPNTTIVKPEDKQQDAGTSLSAPQGSVSQTRMMVEKSARKRKANPQPRDDSKLKLPTGIAGDEKQDKASTIF